jgi:hypothetical protein
MHHKEWLLYVENTNAYRTRTIFHRIKKKKTNKRTNGKKNQHPLSLKAEEGVAAGEYSDQRVHRKPF